MKVNFFVFPFIWLLNDVSGPLEKKKEISVLIHITMDFNI